MMDYTTQIESFILGELDGAEREAFIEAMRHDPALAEEVERQRELMARLDGMRLREHIRRNKSDLKPFRRVSWPMWIGIAASLTMLLVCLVWIFRKYPAATLEEPQYTQREPYDETSPVEPQIKVSPDLTLDETPGESRDKTNTAKAAIPFAKARSIYHAELDRLEVADHGFMGSEENAIDFTDRIRMSMDEMRAERPAEALRMLHGIRTDVPAWYTDDLDWMEALCQLLVAPEKGIRNIELIAGDPSHEYRIRAMQVLEKLQQ